MESNNHEYSELNDGQIVAPTMESSHNEYSELNDGKIMAAEAGATLESSHNEYSKLNDGQIMVAVLAPATLQGGFTFKAYINGDPRRTLACEVPAGGVEQGEMFYTPLPKDFPGPRMNITVGGWRDGLFDCCSFGIVHPHLWCSLLCPQVMMAQVMSRMELNVFGCPASITHTKRTFSLVVSAIVCYVLFSIIFDFSGRALGREHSHFYNATNLIGATLFFSWFILTLSNTRRSVRTQYSIPETIPEKYCRAGWEDFCCSVFCNACTVAQLARHTGNYETYTGNWCSKTGLSNAPPLV